MHSSHSNFLIIPLISFRAIISLFQDLVNCHPLSVLFLLIPLIWNISSIFVFIDLKIFKGTANYFMIVSQLGLDSHFLSIRLRLHVLSRNVWEVMLDPFQCIIAKAHNGKKIQKRGDICLCIANSLCCTVEMNATL